MTCVAPSDSSDLRGAARWSVDNPILTEINQVGDRLRVGCWRKFCPMSGATHLDLLTPEGITPTSVNVYEPFRYSLVEHSLAFEAEWLLLDMTDPSQGFDTFVNAPNEAGHLTGFDIEVGGTEVETPLHCWQRGSAQVCKHNPMPVTNVAFPPTSRASVEQTGPAPLFATTGCATQQGSCFPMAGYQLRNGRLPWQGLAAPPTSATLSSLPPKTPRRALTRTPVLPPVSCSPGPMVMPQFDNKTHTCPELNCKLPSHENSSVPAGHANWYHSETEALIEHAKLQCFSAYCPPVTVFS